MTDATVKGAVAGTVGVWAMDVVTWLMYRKESQERLEQEKAARVFGKDVAHAAARHLARLAGSDAARDEPNAGGIFIHYLLGIGPEWPTHICSVAICGSAPARALRGEPACSWSTTNSPDRSSAWPVVHAAIHGRPTSVVSWGTWRSAR
jgi:hypothetical protein